MFGAIATWNGVPPVAVQRHVAYISTHEGALHEQHRASRRVDAASRRADAPAAGTRGGRRPPPPANPSTGPAAPAASGRRRGSDARRARCGVRSRSARQPAGPVPGPADRRHHPRHRLTASSTSSSIVRHGLLVRRELLHSLGSSAPSLCLGYFAYMESSRGQTIGKQVMKLKTVGPGRPEQPDHGAGGPPQHLVRSSSASSRSSAGLLAELGLRVILIAVSINSDPRRQHWFDKFAGGTQVMKIG